MKDPILTEKELRAEHVISGKRLACLIANCHRLLRHKYRKTPLWAMVRDITSHGSTYSVEICLQAGYDPNQNCGVAKLKASAPNDEMSHCEPEAARGSHEKDSK